MSKELNKAPVEQAGGDEREAAIAKFAETCPMTAESAAGGNSYDIELRRYYLLGWDDRTALAQPSPAQAEGFTHFPELLESVQQMDAMLKAEVERPEVVGSAWRNIYNNGFDHVAPFPPAPGGPVVDEPLMTVAQHAASVARWAEMFNRVEQERDAALARVAELEKQEPVAWVEVIDRDYGPYNFHGKRLLPKGKHQLYASPVAQAQQLHELDKQCRDDVARALGLRPSQERGFAWSYLLASIKSCVKASEDAAQAQHSVPDVCDGKEQDAFEEWARKEGLDTSCHPMHWLFLDAKTNSARQGWKAALRYVRAQVAAAPGKEGA